jgi:hypothetical protein
MSITYVTKIIIGCKIPFNDTKTTVSEGIYEKQNRYNSVTGEVSKVVEVCVKQPVYEYNLGNKRSNCVYDLETKYSDFIDAFLHENQDFYVGHTFEEKGDYDFYSPEGEYSLIELVEIFSKVAYEIEKMPIDTEKYPVKMYMLKLFT